MTAVELPVSAETADYAIVWSDYHEAREDVVRAAGEFADAVERAADLRAQIIAKHSALIKSGTAVPRPMPGTLPGTSMSGLRNRFIQACARRW